MKALSLSRPWPYAVLHLGKPLDNRRRKDGRMPHICRHRGPLLLHAAKSWDRDAVPWMVERGLLSVRDAIEVAKNESHIQCMRPGGIVGRCWAVAHLDPAGRLWLDPEGTETDQEIEACLDRRWHFQGSYALVLDGVETTPFIPCRGHLGLWTPPDEVLEQLGIEP